MSVIADLKTLYHIMLAPVRGATHAERLESFYRGQADSYDDFRKRLLRGRQELYQSIAIPSRGTWLDMGGGTGANIEFIASSLSRLQQVQIVDLSPSLLNVAQKRISDRSWRNVTTVEADATRFTLSEGSADIVTFSYSLTMIPDWEKAMKNARRLLRPGGIIGVVDFYVSEKTPLPERVRHNWLTRHFWPMWFGFDHVHLSPQKVNALHRLFQPISFHECRAPVPYLPVGRVPYFRFVGRKSR